MDITQFVVASREKALLYGDYAVYRKQLGHRLLACRKKLHVATRPRAKFNPKALDSLDSDTSPDHILLLVLTAERAFAHAMAMKAAHTASKRGAITGRTRSHIVSRLDKAAKTAEHLVSLVPDQNQTDARAYAELLRGAALLEKQAWKACLAHYAAAWALYKALAAKPKDETETNSTKDKQSKESKESKESLLVDTVEPPLRYAAYQQKMPRSKPLPAIVRDVVAPDVAQIARQIDPAVLDDDVPATATTADGDAVRTIVWRGRRVRLEDASIVAAWAALDEATDALSSTLASRQNPSERAAAYDDVLTAGQDVVDAIKAVMDDLRGEGLPASDPSLQTLYMARTAATYEMISHRIGRNRELTGAGDGAFDERSDERSEGKKNERSEEKKKKKNERSEGKKLKENVVLYDGTLQSLETVQDLPGVAADAALAQQLAAAVHYFAALRALAIARSYGSGTALHQHRPALALVQYALGEADKAVSASTSTSTETEPETTVRTLDVARTDVLRLQTLLQAELQRYRALVEVDQLTATPAKGTTTTTTTLADHLAYYPANVDLDRVVAYPPTVAPLPAKPTFLDIAWNYIGYPGKDVAASVGGAAAAATTATPEKTGPQKRGWFGFGR